MKINKLRGLIAIACCAAAAGCVSLPKSYKTSERPVYPKLGDSVQHFYQVIDTLQPVLQWKDVKAKGQTYDVALWETRSQPSDESMTALPLKRTNWGKQVYYVQGIRENYFRISKPLKPNTCYHWSVRLRTGNDVSQWATFSQGALSPIGLGWAYNLPYGFITPRG